MKFESDPDLNRKIFENHRSDPDLTHQCKTFCTLADQDWIFILPHEAKELLELFWF